MAYWLKIRCRLSCLRCTPRGTPYDLYAEVMECDKVFHLMILGKQFENVSSQSTWNSSWRFNLQDYANRYFISCGHGTATWKATYWLILQEAIMLYNKENTRVDNGYSHHTRRYVRDCVVCGDEFRSCSQKRSKYCSARCANDAYIAWRREKAAKKRISADKCCVCGEVVVQNGTKISLYCSNGCKQKAYRERVKSRSRVSASSGTT